MAFIDTIPDSEITEEIRAMYARQESFWGFVPNYARVFSWRPEMMGLWAQLQLGIKKHMDKRRFELVTFAAASTQRSTLCSLAHGKALTAWFSMEDVQLMARGASPASLTAAESEMMSFARKVARGAFMTTANDVERLKKLGFTDAEVFDIAATVGARAARRARAGAVPESGCSATAEQRPRAATERASWARAGWIGVAAEGSNWAPRFARASRESLASKLRAARARRRFAASCPSARAVALPARIAWRTRMAWH